jgi:hypothetical protein
VVEPQAQPAALEASMAGNEDATAAPEFWIYHG